MTGFTYSIGFKVTGDSAFSRIISTLDKLDGTVNKLSGHIDKIGTHSENAARRSRTAFSGMESSVGSWVATLGIGIATLASLNTAAQVEGLEKAITFANAADGAKNIAFIRDNADSLGLSLEASYKGFKQLQGGLMGTKLTGQQTRDIFYAVSEGAAAMRLSADETNGVFLALGQIASKGKVQAEELRGQLGERLPGAFNIAARAMGMTTQELNKMLDKGGVLSEDFLPKFAAEMHRTFGGAVPEAMKSATANFARFQNVIFDLKRTFGEELLPVVIPFLKDYIIPGVKWISEHSKGLGLLASAIFGIIAATKIWAVIQGILNALMIANPIGLVIVAMGALTGAVIYAWNKFALFRAVVLSQYEVLKEFGSIVYDFVIAPLMALGKTLLGVFTFDAALIKEGMMDSLIAVQKMTQGVTERIGQAAADGYRIGLDKGFKGMTEQTANSMRSAKNMFFAGATGSSTTENAMDKFFKPFAGTTDKTTLDNGGGGGNLDISKGISGITGGGSKNITINATFGEVTINSASANEGADQIIGMWNSKLTQMLNSQNQNQ